MSKAGPTIYDVSELAGCSIATVSRVLNTPELVKEDTRKMVLRAIDELGFIPKADARDRARKGIGRIGVITPFFTLPSFAQRLRGIAAELIDSPYNVSIYPVDTQTRLDNYYTTLPYSNQVDGLIIVSLPIEEQPLKRFKRNGIPVIFIENHIPDYSSIEIDNYHGGQLAAKHFLKKGHNRCAYVGDTVVPEYTLRPEEQRLAGYRDALEANGVDLPEECIKLPVFPPRDQAEQVHELLNLAKPPSAVFAATDDLALQVLKVAKKRGVQVPKDLAVIGFDDIEFASYLELTTIDQSLGKSGKLAAKRLVEEIETPSGSVENIFIQLKLIERSTT